MDNQEINKLKILRLPYHTTFIYGDPIIFSGLTCGYYNENNELEIITPKIVDFKLPKYPGTYKVYIEDPLKPGHKLWFKIHVLPEQWMLRQI